jgi:hypothetical protein
VGVGNGIPADAGDLPGDFQPRRSSGNLGRNVNQGKAAQAGQLIATILVQRFEICRVDIGGLFSSDGGRAHHRKAITAGPAARGQEQGGSQQQGHYTLKIPKIVSKYFQSVKSQKEIKKTFCCRK